MSRIRRIPSIPAAKPNLRPNARSPGTGKQICLMLTSALNLGAGHGHSVREVIATVERVTDRTVTAIEVDGRAGDPPRLMAAIDLAALHLSWKTRKSPDQI